MRMRALRCDGGALHANCFANALPLCDLNVNMGCRRACSMPADARKAVGSAKPGAPTQLRFGASALSASGKCGGRPCEAAVGSI